MLNGVGALYQTLGKSLGEIPHKPEFPPFRGRMDEDRPLTPDELKKTSFSDRLLGSIAEVNMLQTRADQAVEKMMTGGENGTAEVLTAVQKADIAFKMMMQMRNKLVAAYQEIQAIRV